ncbi:MAG: ATP-binding cassette domain-containing protein [Verrucomicrobia bacterium]|jgi:ABC-type glutathione transport system ATPase component|nr:ATP-binding cassette domain-containing protein [Verrucomicrobiota bacterium]
MPGTSSLKGEENPPLLSCDKLRLGYGGEVVVPGISLAIETGETVALVGESGSGKSTVAKALVGLLRPMGGTLALRGHELGNLTPRQWLPFRKKIQIMFQDPSHALNPRLSVGQLLAEPLRIHYPEWKRAAHLLRIRELLEQVHLPTDVLDRYPAEFSGGQRQRILLARALAVEPELLICDEPVSALDVSIQARLLELLGELKRRTGLALLFISHDLAVVQDMARKVLVMCKGDVVENALAEDLFRSPQHPYTRELIDASPRW